MIEPSSIARIDFLKRNFFNTAIADIYRAIDGGSYIGAFVLTFCLIDYLTWIESGDQNFGYNIWIDKRLKPINIFYETKAEELYSVRCGLIHSYGPSKKITREKFSGYNLMHCAPELHLQKVNSDILIICLYSFLTETIYAAHLMFEELKSSGTSEQLDRMTKQIQIHRTEPPLKFEKMHRALSVFDAPKGISLNSIKADFTAKILYPVN